ncbi:hypothetical protein GH714_030456 [Hevea brasiliensis]|uniref:O-fucosyltransferase family protein n=1 Tax=Hevea brasiliensis TaxID=3981 RepID=A0A6A6LCA4_HEVBR|nr:hypothetical protein GH714_030456 [Hevea brasiliensis]
MGVAKAWRFSVISANLALLQQQNGNHSPSRGDGKHHHHHHSHNDCWRRLRSCATQQRRKIPWSLVCGLMLFILGLISLFTGHVASDLEWMEIGVNRLIYGNPSTQSSSMDAVKEDVILLITDAVVVARILNATLVVPELDHHSYWKDDSDFVNIFDIDWFISYLAKDVTIVKRVPDKVMRSMEKPPYTMRVPRKSPPEYYLDQVLPILLRRRVVQLTKFDYRLANNLDDEKLQKLRCRVNYHALSLQNPYKILDLSAEEERARGKCPLTPHEVGLMLRALGFANDTYIYVASGEIYGGEDTLRPLRELFPNFYTKEMLANEELKTFLPFSSRLAAIDYIVCDESDVFVTNNNGNMAKILAGRRRYAGHKRTIRPNAKRLSALLMERDKMDWDTFAKKVKSCQRGFMGEPDEMRPGRGEFHEYPSPCICEKPFSNEESNNDEAHLLEQVTINSKAKVPTKVHGVVSK